MEEKASVRVVFKTEGLRPPGGLLLVRLRHSENGESKTLEHIPSQPLLFEGLMGAGRGHYRLEVSSSGYKSESRCFRLCPGVNEIDVILHPHDPCDCAPPCKPPKVADRMDGRSLTAHLAPLLAGTPADGTRVESANAATVIWVDHGDELLVHLDSIETEILDGLVLVSLKVECDQTGPVTMVVPFAVSHPNDAAGLVAVTEEFPRGNGLLASRWGSALQAAAWSSLLAVANAHATERDAAPLGIAAVKGTVLFTAGPPLAVAGGVR